MNTGATGIWWRWPLAFGGASLFVFMVFAYLYGPGQPFERVGFGLSYFLIAVLLVIIGTGELLAATAIHECGHFLACKVIGYWFYGIKVGPFALQRHGDRLKFAFAVGVKPFGAVFSFPQTLNGIRPRMFFVGAMGPLFSLLLLTGIGLGWWRAFSGVEVQNTADLGLRFVVGLFGLIALLQFLISAVPSNLGGVASDGRRLFEILWGGPAILRDYANSIQLGLALQNVRPRDVDPEIVAASVSLNDNSESNIFGHWLYYYWALDRRDVQTANAHLQMAISSAQEIKSPLLPSLLLDAAYVEARYHRNPSLAREYIKQAGTSNVQEAMVLRAEAAACLAENNHDEARLRASLALGTLEKAVSTGGKVAEADWLREMIASIDVDLPLRSSDVAAT